MSTRTIRPNTVITAHDIGLANGTNLNAFDRLQDVIGQETRVALYAGRPVLLGDIGPPAVVDRNQIVPIRFSGTRIIITAEGRSLERGGVGDRVRVMNLNSRAVLFGYVQPDGSIVVTQ